MKVRSKEIEMIAVFSTNGEVRPYRFKVTDGNGEKHTITVGKVVTSTVTKFAGISALVFSCQSIFGDTEKRYEIKYRIVDHIWELYKM